MSVPASPASLLPLSLGLDALIGAFDRFPGLVWIVGAEGGLLYHNPAAQAFAGRALGEAETAWLDRTHPEDREHAGATMTSALARQTAFAVEFRIARRDGLYRWLSTQGSPLADAAGHFAGLLNIAHDITDQIATARVRSGPEEDPAPLNNNTRDLVWSADFVRRRIFCQNAAVHQFGLPPLELLQTIIWWRERVHPEDLDLIQNRYREAMETGLTEVYIEYRFRRMDGSYCPVDDLMWLTRSETGQVVRASGALRDISARRLAEEARARLLRIVETTTDFVGMATPDGRVTYLNEAARRLLGFTSEGSLENTWIRDLHPEWAYEIVNQEALPIAIRDGIWKGETALVDRAGRETPVSQLVLGHGGQDGRVEFFSTIMRDISERKREEIERMEWANRYNAAIRSSGQLLFDWNSFTHEITYAGDVPEFLGYTSAEMAGGLDRFRALIVPEDLSAFDSEINRVSSTRDPFRLNFRLRRKNGAEITISAKGYFFLDREGRIGRMVGFFADVTAQKAAEDELAQAHEHLEARVEQRTAELASAYRVIRDRALQQEAVATLGQRALAGADLDTLLLEAADLVRKILVVDFCSILELTNHGTELLARAHAGWPDPELGNRVPTGENSQSGYTLLVHEPVIVEDMSRETRFRISEAAGTFGVTSSASVVIEGSHSPVGVLCAFSVSPRVFVQDDIHFLQAMANVLTAAIERRRAEISVRDAHEQAESANRAKSEFLSRMSHELRTPLNAILGFTQLLELDAPSASQAESIEHISRAGRHLLSLINEVLDIARIESGRLTLDPEPIALGEFLTETVELIRPFAARHGIAIHFAAESAAPHFVRADRQRLKQVFLNLLSNAVKYNRAEGSVRITCASADAERVQIDFSDTGRGISAEKMKRLFVPFERLGAEDTEIEGTGIGLALSRGIVIALQGELSVESEDAVGSTFRVTLPRAEAPPDPAGNHGPLLVLPAIPEVQPTPQALLLYIEDQDLNLRLVERILQSRTSYRLITAMQGGLGLDLAREHQPDLILLDLNLPDMTGEEVLRRLKENPDVRKIPVIMVSADAMGDRIEELLGLGADGYLTKPYKVSEFLQVIADSLARR